MGNIQAIMRPKPRIVGPDEIESHKKWNLAKKSYIKDISLIQRFLRLFVPYKELVHPLDFRIYHHKVLFGKVVSIGYFSWGSFVEVKSFDELVRIETSRYLRG